MDEKTVPPPLRSPQTRLDRACKYLEDKWFPCSSHILSEIEILLRNPSVVETYPKLLKYIEQDYSLTLFCYKELCSGDLELADQDHAEDNILPLEKIKACEPQGLTELLIASMPTLKLHSVESSSTYQIEKLKEALLALVTTKKLCEYNDINPDLGAEVSLFRQIGYLLVAWNYPSIYQAATSQITETLSLEDNLVKALGFSPATLALSLSQKWGLGKIFENSAVSSEDDSILGPNETSSIAKSISRLCEIGEKLARANNPERYPHALHDWEDAKSAIEEALGREGLSLIDQAMTLECEELYLQSPHIFKAGTLLNLEDKLLEREGRRNAARNPYLNSCDDNLKTELLSLYDLIAAGERAEKTVSLLLRKVLPHAGFCSSALFTLEPGTKRLALQLKAGDIKLRQGQNLQEIKHKEMLDIVPLAFHSADVLSQDLNPKIGLDQPPLPACLATFFGCSQRFGVFYVELPSKSYRQDILTYQEKLKALAFTLNDCLELV